MARCTKQIVSFCTTLAIMQVFADCMQEIADQSGFVDGLFFLCYDPAINSKRLHKRSSLVHNGGAEDGKKDPTDQNDDPI